MGVCSTLKGTNSLHIGLKDASITAFRNSIPLYAMVGVVHNKERLLVELIRNKRKFSFDLYKELVESYRKIVHELDMNLVAE